jgi:hypothetical protein
MTTRTVDQLCDDIRLAATDARNASKLMPCGWNNRKKAMERAIREMRETIDELEAKI